MYTLYYSAGREIFSIKIGAEDLSRLYLHEETVHHALQKLVKAFKKSKFQYHPIIVDEKSKVILDGMHRASAMKELGYPRVAVCFVDYFSKLIEVKNWYRVFIGVDFSRVINAIKDICRNYGLIFEEKRIGEYNLRGQSTDSIDLIVRDKVFIIKGPQNKYSLYRIVSYLDNKIKSLSNSIKYLILIKTNNNEIVAIHELEYLEEVYSLLRDVYGITKEEFEQIMLLPKKTYKDYK